jgi:hypothetical protein
MFPTMRRLTWTIPIGSLGVVRAVKAEARASTPGETLAAAVRT